MSKRIPGLAEIASVDADNDYLIIYDASTGATKKVKIADLFTGGTLNPDTLQIGGAEVHYSTTTIDLTGSGHLTAGTLVLTKIGRTVTAHWYGVTHASLTYASTGIVVPEAYWPVSGEPYNAHFFSELAFAKVRYASGGYLQFTYYGSATTGPNDGSITWVTAA